MPRQFGHISSYSERALSICPLHVLPPQRASKTGLIDDQHGQTNRETPCILEGDSRPHQGRRVWTLSAQLVSPMSHWLPAPSAIQPLPGKVDDRLHAMKQAGPLQCPSLKVTTLGELSNANTEGNTTKHVQYSERQCTATRANKWSRNMPVNT